MVWCGFKSNNKKVSPVGLLVLGLLRYLGCGWTFDDCEESTAIDKEVHCCFFQVFIICGSTELYQKWVITPVNLPEANSNMHEYSEAGFPGCVGSCDCTHIVTKRCEYNLKGESATTVGGSLVIDSGKSKIGDKVLAQRGILTCFIRLR